MKWVRERLTTQLVTDEKTALEPLFEEMNEEEKPMMIFTNDDFPNKCYHMLPPQVHTYLVKCGTTFHRDTGEIFESQSLQRNFLHITDDWRPVYDRQGNYVGFYSDDYTKCLRRPPTGKTVVRIPHGYVETPPYYPIPKQVFDHLEAKDCTFDKDTGTIHGANSFSLPSCYYLVYDYYPLYDWDGYYIGYAGA